MVCLMPAAAKSLQSCLTLCDPIDASSPGFSIPWILQAVILEWLAIAFSMVYLMDKALCLFVCLFLSRFPSIGNELA